MWKGGKHWHVHCRWAQGRVSSYIRTLIVPAVQVASMASVHPPSGAVLEGTVAVIPVVVVVRGAELHASVRGVDLVTRILPEVKAIEGVSRSATKVVGIVETVLVLLCSNSEHGVVGMPGGGRLRVELNFCYLSPCIMLP